MDCKLFLKFVHFVQIPDRTKHPIQILPVLPSWFTWALQNQNPAADRSSFPSEIHTHSDYLRCTDLILQALSEDGHTPSSQETLLLSLLSVSVAPRPSPIPACQHRPVQCAEVTTRLRCCTVKRPKEWTLKPHEDPRSMGIGALCALKGPTCFYEMFPK